MADDEDTDVKTPDTARVSEARSTDYVTELENKSSSGSQKDQPSQQEDPPVTPTEDQGGVGGPNEDDGMLIQDGDETNLTSTEGGMEEATVVSSEQTIVPEVVVLPEASPEALDYIRKAVEETEQQQLYFKDRLVTVSDTGKELGEYTVSIEPIRRQAEPCLLIHANSNGSVDGVPCGTSIVCYVCPTTLETLEQHHHEFVKLEHRPLDRKTVILRQRDNYLVTKVVASGKDVRSTSTIFSLESMEGFISEGSNMLLNRYFILHGMPDEELQFICFDSEDNLCPTVYRKMQCRKQKVEDTELLVMGVERTIESRLDLPTMWQSYFTLDGFLANRTQVGCPVTMTLLKKPDIKDEQKPIKPAFEKKELAWDDDLQLYSKYLDRKEELKNSHQTFLRHHPELRALLADFLQFLLLVKPTDVLQFSANYFAPFSEDMKATPPYHASAIPPLFPHCTTNPEIERLKALNLGEVVRKEKI